MTQIRGSEMGISPSGMREHFNMYGEVVCWHCGKKFYGNYWATVVKIHGLSRYVHKRCANEYRDGYDKMGLKIGKEGGYA